MLRHVYEKVTAPFDEAIARAGDPDDVRLGKRLFVRFTLAFLVMGGLSMIAGIVLDDPISLWGGLSAGLIFLLYLVLLRRTRRFKLLFNIWVLLILLLPAAIAASYGGFVINQFFLWFSFLPLLMVVLITDRKTTLRWFAVFAIIAIAATLLDPFFADPESVSPSHTADLLSTTLTAAVIILLTLTYYKRQKNSALELLSRERERSENLLLNILPKEVAETLKTRKGVIAEDYEEASILYADIVGFTPLTARMKPEEMVGLLNEIFSEFDSLVEAHGAEKIRTIGDNYMVVCGVPARREDHAHAIANLSLDMQASVRKNKTLSAHGIDFRVGINSGPLVAGVIGHKKFQYDVWGDAVNLASRMESQGVPGKIQVTAATHNLLKENFEMEKRGKVDIKGKGEIQTWFLVGSKA